jgi:hypothetical protein
MKNSFFQISCDVAGFGVSMICAIHCMVLPVLLSLTTLGSLAFLENQSFEYLIFVLSALIGMISLLPAYFKRHKKLYALYLFGIGLLLIASGRIAFIVMDEVLAVTGALAIASSHFLNWKLCTKGKD